MASRFKDIVSVNSTSDASVFEDLGDQTPLLPNKTLVSVHRSARDDVVKSIRRSSLPSRLARRVRERLAMVALKLLVRWQTLSFLYLEFKVALRWKD